MNSSNAASLTTALVRGIARQSFPPVHPQARANYAIGVRDATVREGVCCAMGREADTATALSRGRMHTLYVYHMSGFRNDPAFRRTDCASMHALPLR